MTKLLAVDLDGTLIRRDGQIDARDRHAIREVLRRGVPVTIVTGRLYAGTRAIVEQLGIRSPVACADGAQLVDPSDGRELEHLGIVATAADVLRRTLATRPVSSFLLFDEVVLHDARGAPFTRYVRSWSPALEQVERLYEHACWESDRGLSGAVVVGPNADVAVATTELRDSGLLEVFDFPIRRTPAGETVTSLRAMLARARGATKGTAIVRLAARCGCRTAEVATIGDWLNDVEMFAQSGRSFVMAHAPAEVKQAATDCLRADARSGGGVAETVELLWPRQHPS